MENIAPTFRQQMEHIPEKNNKINDVDLDVPPSMGQRRPQDWKEIEEFYTVFHDGPFGYLIIDERGYIQRFNKVATEILGHPDSMLKRKRLLDFLFEDGKKKMMALLLENPTTWFSPLRLVKTKYMGTGTRLITYFLKGFSSTTGKQAYCVLLLRNDFIPGDENCIQHEVLCKTIINTQEAERAAIGASLHDTVAQYLYGIHLHLQHLALKDISKAEIAPIQLMLQETIHLIRDFSNDLTPAFLRTNGLRKAVSHLATKLSLPGFEINVKVDEKVDTLCPEMQLCMYRIIQELVNNGMKHAHASKMKICICLKEATVEISVTDNGRGFKSIMEKENGGVRFGSGLQNIQNRVLLYAGTIEIKTDEQGTTIQIKLKKDPLIN